MSGMATSSVLIVSSQFMIYTLIISSFSIIQVTGEDQAFARTLDPANLLGRFKQEKLTHFRVYWHDVYSGSNPSAMAVVKSPSNTSATLFGSISMIDDPLTEGPASSSKLVGKAQGFYGSASQQDVGLIMAMNFVFLEGKYNGSAISILGRNEVFSKVREMPVIGGSGLFRFARGYVQASTYSYNATSGDAVVEYNVYVLHY